MDSPETTKSRAAESGAIDYDHVDVAVLMETIRKAAAEAPPSAPAGEALLSGGGEASLQPASSSDVSGTPGGGPIPFRPSPPEAAPGASGPPGLKSKLKKIVRKLMRPFFPVIRLFGLPLHEEIRAMTASLHETNKRLDYLDRLLDYHEAKFDRSLQILERRLERRMEDLEREFRDRVELADERMEKGELRLDALEGRQKDLDKSMVYIQLLHSLSHNLVVEMTKLKIESDTLKTKFRIMEKDQELLQQREKAVERLAVK